MDKESYLALEKTRDEIYMKLANGLNFYPFNPDYSIVDVETIAQHLATKGRWAGATRHPNGKFFYSVAEHSVLVSYVVEDMYGPEYSLEGLLHDGVEAILDDQIRPLKYEPEFAKVIKPLEKKNEINFAQVYGLSYDEETGSWPEKVKLADDAMMRRERQLLIDRDKRKLFDYDMEEADLGIRGISMLSPEAAKEEFIERYREIVFGRIKSVKPCPICGTELKRLPMLKKFLHDNTGCILDKVDVNMEKLDQWNNYA